MAPRLARDQQDWVATDLVLEGSRRLGGPAWPASSRVRPGV